MGNVSFGDAAGLRRWQRHRIGKSATKMIKHRVDCNFGLAAEVMARVERRFGDAGLFFLAGFLGSIAIPEEVSMQEDPPSPTLSFEREDGELETVSLDEVPPFVRANVRMLASLAYRDGETALCVWRTMPSGDKRGMIKTFTDMAAIGFTRHVGRSG